MPSYFSSLHLTIYAIIAACAFPILFSMLAKALGGFKFSDNAAPREFLKNTTGLAQRAHAVQQNSFEVLPFFLASVLMATFVMVVPQHIISHLAWMFIVTRVFYALAYMLNKPMLRSCLWMLSVACPTLLLILSLKS